MGLPSGEDPTSSRLRSDATTDDEDAVISASVTRTPVPETVPGPELVYNSMNEVVSNSMNEMVLDHQGMVYDAMNFTWVPGNTYGQVEYSTVDNEPFQSEEQMHAVHAQEEAQYNNGTATSSDEENYVPSHEFTFTDPH